MPNTKPCPFCRRAGLIRFETVIAKGFAYRSIYCGGCNRTWRTTESGERLEAEEPPPDRSRSDFNIPPLKRR